jgi:hypothetical protein
LEGYQSLDLGLTRNPGQSHVKILNLTTSAKTLLPNREVALHCIFISLFHISIHRSWVLIFFYIQSVMIDFHDCFGWNIWWKIQPHTTADPLKGFQRFPWVCKGYFENYCLKYSKVYVRWSFQNIHTHTHTLITFRYLPLYYITPYCFSKWLYQFTFPLVVLKISCCSITLSWGGGGKKWPKHCMHIWIKKKKHLAGIVTL